MNDILIVEADAAIARLLAEVLVDAGYQTRIANDSNQAHLIVQESTPALILLDIAMPMMDGYIFLQDIRQRGYASLPVIITSADPQLGQLRKLGVTSILHKPFRLTELIKSIGTHLPLQSLSPGPCEP